MKDPKEKEHFPFILENYDSQIPDNYLKLQYASS